MKIFYKCIVGSKLYGISTPESDTDMKGFGMPDLNYIIGLNRQETDRTVNLTDNTDEQLHSVGKYLSVLLQGNPTVFEIAFAGNEFVVEQTEEGKRIIQFVRSNFITKHLFKPYSAYFRAQKEDVTRCRTKGNRTEMIAKYGYDIKSASHTARIGFQCIELMKTGWLNPTLQGEERKICFEIKTGKWSLNDLNLFLIGLDKEMYSVYKECNLPERPNRDKVDQFCMDTYMQYLLGEYLIYPEDPDWKYKN